jgi:hypothetical protein
LQALQQAILGKKKLMFQGKNFTSVACQARRENGVVENIPNPVGQAQTMHERSPLKETAVIGDKLFLTRIRAAALVQSRCSRQEDVTSGLIA